MRNEEIDTFRKLHEKGLLQKVSGVEEKLNNYISGINKSIDDVKAGKENVKMPNLDVDAVKIYYFLFFTVMFIQFIASMSFR